MTPNQDPNRPLYLYLDVETPGLYAEQGVLEVAWFVTDDIDKLNGAIRSYLNGSIDVERAHDEAVDFVKKMHTDSGLWRRLTAPSAVVPERLPLGLIDESIAFELRDWRGPIYLVGNSIRLDRAVLERWFPAVSAKLHYRQIDLTSVRLWLEAKGIDTAQSVKIESTHIAGQDVLDSLNYQVHLGRLVMKPREAVAEALTEIQDMIDSLDDHINREDVAEQLTQLRKSLAESL